MNHRFDDPSGDRAWLDRTRLVRPLLALLLLGCVAAAARADDKWPVPVGPSREPAPFRYDAKLWKDVPKDFLDDAAACILYAGNTYLVEPDGTIETITHEITRLNGRKGIEKLGEYRNITYDPAYEKLTLNDGRIHKADGHDVAIEPRHVQLRDVGHRLPGLRPRQAAHHQLPHPRSRRRHRGQMDRARQEPRARRPVLHPLHLRRRRPIPCVTDELRVRLPKAMPFKYAAFDGKLDPVINDDEDDVALLLEGGPTASCRRTTTCRPRKSCAVGVACSTFASWEEVGRWKQQLREDCWDCTADVRADRAGRHARA